MDDIQGVSALTVGGKSGPFSAGAGGEVIRTLHGKIESAIC